MKIDFEDYLLTVQKQVDDMNKAVEEANQLLADGKMSAETAEFIKKQMEIINANYQRLMYCKYLYTLPPKFIQKWRNKKLQKQAEKFMKEQADKEAVVKENKEALDTINDYIDEVTEDGPTDESC